MKEIIHIIDEMIAEEQSKIKTNLYPTTHDHKIEILTELKIKVSRVELPVMQKIAETIKKEADEWNITIHCKDIEETALLSSIAKDQVKLFAEYISNYILDDDSNFSA